MNRLRKALKKFFIPHEENDHRPHILRWQTVAFVLVLALGVESLFIYGASSLAPRSKLFGIIITNALIDETNQNRTTNGDATLTVSPLLNAAAQEKANDMVTNNYFAHTSPSGLSPWYWFEQVGYNFTSAGENLAVNFSDSQDVTDAWMNSPEHRANILNANFTQIGMATATGTYEGHPAIYVVELFGTPAPAAPPAEPIAFVNSAAAAAVPSTKAPESVVAAGAPSAKTPQSVSKSKALPPKTASVSAPATTSLAVTTSNPTFVSIQGATTGSLATTLGAVTTTVENNSAPVALANLAPEVNPVQAAAANPRSLVDDLYLAIIILFALALGINIFVKIHIQHPQLIFGGMIVILVAGLLIVLNQHALASAAIL